MPYYQQTQVLGHAGSDAVYQQSENGTEYAKFSIAYKKYGDKGTDWYRVTVFGKQAQFARDRVRKGCLVQAVGNLEVEEYNGKPQLNLRAQTILVFDKPKEAAQTDGIFDADDIVPF